MWFTGDIVQWNQMLITLKGQTAELRYNRQYGMIQGILEDMESNHIINNLNSGQKIPQYPGVPW